MNTEQRTPGRTIDTIAAEHALSVWLTMWNSSSDIARRICSDDFRIHLGTSEPDSTNPGDRVHGADEFAAFLDRYHETHPGVVFTDRHHALDGAHGRMIWDVDAAGRHLGGIDVFDFTEDGLIREVWSVTGTRSLVG